MLGFSSKGGAQPCQLGNTLPPPPPPSARPGVEVGHWTLKRNVVHKPGPLNSERLVPSSPATTEVGGQWPCLTQSHAAFGPGLQGTSDEADRRTPK